MSTYNCIIIDDVQHQIELLKNTLTKMENTTNLTVVAMASSVSEAYIKIKKYKPDIIFLDIKMSPQSGLELLPLIRKIENYTYFVIFVTVSAEFEYIKAAFNFSFVDYIVKPVPEEQLKVAIEETQARIRKGERQNLDVFLKNLESPSKIIVSQIDQETRMNEIIDVSDISYVGAENSSSLLQTKKRTYIFSKSMKNILELLRNTQKEKTEKLRQGRYISGYYFMKVYKSFVINISYVVRYNSNSVYLDNGTNEDIIIPISKDRLQVLKKVISLHRR